MELYILRLLFEQQIFNRIQWYWSRNL